MAALRMGIEEAAYGVEQTCLFCERVFLLQGVVVRLHGVDRPDNTICPECLALPPERVVRHLREKARKIAEQAEAVESLAHKVEEMKPWPTAGEVDDARTMYILARQQPQRKRTARK